jgi:hypothetical protein
VYAAVHGWHAILRGKVDSMAEARLQPKRGRLFTRMLPRDASARLCPPHENMGAIFRKYSEPSGKKSE